MRERFKWYLSPSEDEVREIWQRGVLTVDANVLLDTYRYHEKTRQAIKEAIDAFEVRVWLSNQAAVEFVRNRKTVIISADKTFKDVEESFRDLRANVDKGIAALTSFRLVPREDLEELNGKIASAIEAAEVRFSESKNSHPNYLKLDPILDWVVGRFEGRLGNEPTSEELKILHQEAEARKLGKIPPGYLDDDKSGVRPYGDYLLWRQTLSQAKLIGLPMILVTSERKEDWWERISGRTVGLRAELMKEALEFSGQRVLVYQTETFLRVAAEQIGRKVNEAAVEEIRQVSNRRSLPFEAAISVEHLPEEPGHSGFLEVTVLRPVQNFTCTAQLGEGYEDLREGEVSAELLECPSGLPRTVLRAKSVQKGDIGIVNVHFHSLEHGTPLPIGQYVFAYSVTFPQVTQNIEDNPTSTST